MPLRRMAAVTRCKSPGESGARTSMTVALVAASLSTSTTTPGLGKGKTRRALRGGGRRASISPTWMRCSMPAFISATTRSQRGSACSKRSRANTSNAMPFSLWARAWRTPMLCNARVPATR